MSGKKEEYIPPNDDRRTVTSAARPDAENLELEQDHNTDRTFRSGSGDFTSTGLSATGGLPSTGPADQGVVAPQSATVTHGVTEDEYPHVGSAQSGSSVDRGLAQSEGNDTSLSESQQDAVLDGSYAARPGVENDAPVGPQTGVDGRPPAVSNTAHIGAVPSLEQQLGSSAGDSTTLPEDEQDAILDGSFAARPGAEDATPAGVSATTLPSGEQDDILASSFAARPGAKDATPAGPSGSSGTTLPEGEQEDILASSFAARPGAKDATPAGLSDSALPEDEQDAILAGSFAARPGAEDASPAGLPEATSGANDGGLSASVKNSLDSVADDTAPRSFTDQLPNTQSITEKLPTTQSVAEHLPTTQQATETAQNAAGSVARGASSLLAGISNLAFGARNVTSETAAQSHPESENAHDAEDLHVPGAFESETSDRDDLNAVKQALPSTEGISRNLPDANAVRASVTGSERPIVDQASDAARSAQDTISGYIPDANTARSKVTGSERPIVDQASDAARSAQDSIAGYIPDANTTRSNITGSERPIADQASDAARSAQDSVAGYIPDANTIRSSITGSERPVGEQASDATRSAQDSIAGYIPDANTTRSNITGSEQPIVDQASDKARSAQNSISSQIPDANTARASVTGSERPLVDQASDAASAAQVKAQQGLDYAKEKLFGRTNADEDTPSDADSGINAPGSEARAVPDIVADSYRKAGETAPLDLPAYDAGEEQNKRAALDQPTTDNAGSTGQSSSGPGIGGAIAGGLAAAGAAIAGAADYARHQTHQTTGTDPVTILPESAQRAIDPQTASNTSDASLQRGEAPQVVQDSQNAAGVDPEASANPMAVQDKNDVEAELKRAVQPAPASSENNTMIGAVTGGLASAGTAAANAARSAQEQVAGQLPDADTARANITGSERPIGEQAQEAALNARDRAQQVAADPVSVLPVSAQQTLGRNTATGSTGQDYPSVPQNHQTESYLTSSSGPEPGTGVVPLDDGAIGKDYPSVPPNHQTESHLTSSSGPEPGTGVAPLDSGAVDQGYPLDSSSRNAESHFTPSSGPEYSTGVVDPAGAPLADGLLAGAPLAGGLLTGTDEPRPAHAGAVSDLPRDTAESSDATDLSYENRPKTLPQSEIAAREQERGLGEGTLSAEHPIAFHPISETPTHGNVDIHSGVHNGVVGAGSAHPLGRGNVDLHSGVHNGVVGNGSAHPLGSTQYGAANLSYASSKPREDAEVGHITDDLEGVDLSKGVRNGVVGAGAKGAENVRAL